MTIPRDVGRHQHQVSFLEAFSLPSFYPFPLRLTSLLRFTEWGILRKAAHLAYTTGNPVEFDRKSQDQSLELSRLSPESVDILAIICYARRHVKLLPHLLGMFPAVPESTTFDAFDTVVLEPRLNPYLKSWGHSKKGRMEFITIEAQLWTAILNAGWIHDAAIQEIGYRLHRELYPSCKAGEDGIPFGTPVFFDWIQAVANRLRPYVDFVGTLLICCRTLEEARDVVAVFPVDKLYNLDKMRKEREAGVPLLRSGDIPVLIAESNFQDEALKIDILKLVLDWYQDVDMNGTMDRWEEFSHMTYFTALHRAAQRGDGALARFLVEKGARVDKVERLSGLTASGFARREGHEALAVWLETRPTAHDG